MAVTTNHSRMLGVARQPFCKKCCGETTQAGNARQKRAERRASKQKFTQYARIWLDNN